MSRCKAKPGSFGWWWSRNAQRWMLSFPWLKPLLQSAYNEGRKSGRAAERKREFG